MKLPDGEFVWGLGDNSSKDMTIRVFKAFARAMYKSYCSDLADTNVFDKSMQDHMKMIQDRLVARGQLKLKVGHYGTLDFDTELATGFRRPIPVYAPKSIIFSINGAGSTWDMGYPWDIGQTLDHNRVYHQPIGYNTKPIPMNTGVKDGQLSFLTQLDRPRSEFGGHNCTTIPWTYIFYSMGALVGCGIVDRIIHDGDLKRFKPTYLGGATFGNPRRQKDHTFPGCSWSSGEGISTPTDHDMPVEHWDMAADKHMPGSGGDDLYTKMADDESPGTVKDMHAVWDIVNKGNPLNLAMAVMMLLAKPSFSGGYDAAVAAFKALDFFVVKQTGPHVKYQFTLPIDGDPRDSWEIARAHVTDLAYRMRPVYPLGVAA